MGRNFLVLAAAALVGGCITESIWEEYNDGGGDDAEAPAGYWGSACKGAGDCDAGLTCAMVAGKPAYCTRACTQLLRQCTGTPGKTAAFCQGTGSGKVCVFVCKVTIASQAKSFPCPTGLKCSTAPGKPGTSICVP